MDGFIKIKEDAPLKTFYAENFVPSSNKLLALYLSQNDYNELLSDNDLDFNKYIVVQYFKKDEYQNIEEKEFKKFVKEIKLSFSNLLYNDSDEFNKWLNNFERKFDIRVNIGERINLGKLMETEKLISYITLSNIRVNSIKGNINKNLISSVNFLYIKNKILYIYIFSDFSLPKRDLKWLSDTTIQFLNNIILSN